MIQIDPNRASTIREVASLSPRNRSRAPFERMNKDPVTSREALFAMQTAAEPAVLTVTQDDSLIELVTKASGLRKINIEVRFDAPSAREFLFERNVRLVIVDDGAVAEGERGWLLDQIRRRLPDAFIIYLASQHGPDVEKRARTHGVLYYTAKPVDTGRLTQVLRRLAKSLPSSLTATARADR